METKTLKLLVPYILFSASVYPIAKDGLGYGSPFILMGLRYLLSAIFFSAMTRKLLWTRSVVLLGAALSASTVLWILGLQYVSSGESAVLSYTMPFFAIIGSGLALHEKATAGQVLGTVIGFLGMVLFTVPLSHGFVLVGALLTIAGALSWALYTIYLRKLKDEDRSQVLGTAYLVGCAPFVVGLAVNHDVDWTLEFVADSLYLALIGGMLAIYLLITMLREERVGAVTSMFFVIPAASLAIQILQTGVLPGAFELVGCAVILFGVYVAGKR